MTTDLDQILTIKNNTLAQLASVSAERKPSYVENGVSFSWTEYLEHLQRRVDWCNQMLTSQEPFEVETRGYVE